MKKSVQAGKYIVSDFIASSVVWLLFNLIRYEEVAVYEGFDTVGAFLLHIPSLKGQLLIPFFWFVLYWFSGYYNKPFGKSFSTKAKNKITTPIDTLPRVENNSVSLDLPNGLL